MSDVHITVRRKESLSDHGPFTLIQQQHLPRLKARANWHIACAPSVHLGSLALPYRCEGVHVGSSVLVVCVPVLDNIWMRELQGAAVQEERLCKFSPFSEIKAELLAPTI